MDYEDITASFGGRNRLVGRRNLKPEKVHDIIDNLVDDLTTYYDETGIDRELETEFYREARQDGQVIITAADVYTTDDVLDGTITYLEHDHVLDDDGNRIRGVDTNRDAKLVAAFAFNTDDPAHLPEYQDVAAIIHGMGFDHPGMAAYDPRLYTRK